MTKVIKRLEICIVDDGQGGQNREYAYENLSSVEIVGILWTALATWTLEHASTMMSAREELSAPTQREKGN